VDESWSLVLGPRPSALPQAAPPAISTIRTSSASESARILSMTLDGLGADAKRGCNLLVRPAIRDHEHDLVLARRQLCHARGDVRPLRPQCALLLVVLQRVLDADDERLVVEGLLDEVHGAALHGLHGHGHIAVAGDHDHRDALLAAREIGLQLQPAHARHAHIKQETAGAARIVGVQEVLRGRVGLDAHAHGLDQPLQRAAHGLVVVDDEDGLFSAHRPTPAASGGSSSCAMSAAPCSASGRRTWNMVPAPGSDSARISPPWSSMMV